MVTEELRGVHKASITSKRKWREQELILNLWTFFPNGFNYRLGYDFIKGDTLSSIWIFCITEKI